MKLVIAIFAIVTLFAVSLAGDLKFVSVLYRHGDRLPANIYPTDPYRFSVWKNRTGELTNLGKNKSYQFGKYIRERYKDFLPSEYREEDIYVLSSEVSRALMTAYCVLAGLYEPLGDDVWSESINWQPIPVRSIPSKDDNMLNKRKPCPKYDKLLNDQLAPNSEIIDKYKEILKELSRYSGYAMPNDTLEILKTGTRVYDSLFVEEKSGLKLPEWSKKFYPEALTNIKKFRYSIEGSNTQLRRLDCGPLLKDIVNHLEEIRQGKSRLKMWQYSAHDGTVLNLLQCLDVYDGEFVPYLGAVFFELYKKENDFEVGIYYKKNDEVKELKIPGCRSPCPLDLFEKLVKNVLPDNWEEECKL